VPTGTSFAGYQFEDCRLDLDRGCLVLHDTEHRLRYQTFQVLLYFAQHPGTLVTKEDLIAAVWKQSFVSSNALVQCIAELRRILDDDPRSPRFIKTLPRVGYLFLPSVVPCERISSPPPEQDRISLPSVDTFESTASDTGAANPLLDNPAVPLEPTDPFDPADPEALWADGPRLSLGQRWVYTLCGIFVLTLAGVSLWTHTLSERRAAMAAQRRHAVGTATQVIPGTTPQTDGDEEPQQSPAADLRSNNPEALRYYSLGVEKAHDFQNAEAIGLLKKAVALDPKFAMAYARIGYAYAVSDFVPERGRLYLGKASEMSTNLTPKGRLYVEAWFEVANADYTRATKIFNQIIEAYPNEEEAHYQLARILEGQEKSAEAISVLKRGLESQPGDGNLYNALGMSFMDLNRFGEAIDAERHYVDLSPQAPNAHDSLGMTYQRAGNYAVATSEYDRALSLDPEFEPAIVHLGDVAFEQGRYREAIREYQRYVQVVHSNDARALGYGDMATVYRALGNRAAEERAAANEMKNDPNAVWSTLLLAEDEGDTHKAARLEQILLAHAPNHERGIPSDLRTQLYHRAYLDLMRGDVQLAIAQFKGALQHLPPSSAIDLHEDCLANAYMRAGMYPEAAAEYQRILQLNSNYPLAQYHLGEVFAGMGDQAKAQAAFARFLQTWKSADQDLPEVVAAKTLMAAASASAVVNPSPDGIPAEAH
jgi:tetratricopeptide (TPR) repeat protein/DNA-binding winged helix-turn-helix (wHTH) protein